MKNRRMQDLRNRALYLAAITYPVLASAQTTSDDTAINRLKFDVTGVDDKALTTLTVGVGVTLAFTVYRVGKRAASKI